MNCRRLISLIAAFVMTMLLFVPAAAAEPIEGVTVVSAPLRRSASVLDGMVRVYLRDMGAKTSLDVTVTGNYSVNGNTAMRLTTGDTVNISFNTSTGDITMVMDGVTYLMGKEMRLRRHQADGDSAVSIAQAGRPNNLYPGDLQLLAVEKNGAYQLYPIVHVYLEYYLYGVVPYEMSASFPVESLKAQAVAARTYSLRQMNARGSYDYDMDDTSSYQVYKGHTATVADSVKKAVDETRGIVIMNNGKLSGTYYTASNGGQTEAVKNAWGSSGYDYLGVKDDPFDELNTSSLHRRLTVYSDFDHASQNAALMEILTAKAQSQLGADAVIQSIDGILPHTPKYPAPSRLYTRMDFDVTAIVGGIETKATLSCSIFDDLETPLSLSLNSGANELWSVAKADGGFRISVGRRGHGIGMSQRGAQQMGRMGYTYDQVLGFYFDGCERVQYTFTHTILPVGGSSDVVSTEPPADFTPGDANQASVLLPGVNDTAPLLYTADENGRVLTAVPNGAVVYVLSKGEDWSLVRYGEISGYLPTNQLMFTGTPEDTGENAPTVITLWGVVTGTNALNFRDAPSFESNVVSELKEGTILCVLGTSGEWVKVQNGTQVGYVSPDYLTMHDEYPAETTADTSAMVSLSGESDTAPLLASPSTAAATIMDIIHGTQVTVLTNDGSWCRVKVAGLEGYLLTSQLDFAATGVIPTDAPGTQGVKAIVNSDAATLNFRSGPSTDHAILAQIPKGSVIYVTPYDDTWSATTWDGESGYVMNKYLLFEDAETPTPSGSPTASPTPTPTPTPGITAEPEEELAWVMRTVNYVNLRETASTEGEIITQIPAGDEVTVLEKGSPFSKVRHGVGTGYVLSQHLTYTKPAASIGIVYVNTVSDSLALRNKPDLYDSEVLVYMPRGEKLMLIEELDGWCKVQFGDYVGYSASSYLSRRKPTDYEVDDTPIYDPSLTAVSGWSAIISTNGAALSMREWCSGEAPELTTIPDGNTVRLLAHGDIWCKIIFEGESGYCLTNNLRLIAPAEE